MRIPKECWGISTVAAREQVGRYWIGGIHVARVGDECRVEATDGKRLVRFTWMETGEPYDTMLDRQAWDWACGISRTRKADLFLDEKTRELRVVERERIPLANTSGTAIGQSTLLATLYSPEIDSPFPKCDDIIPPYEDGKDARKYGVNQCLCSEVMALVGGAAGIDGVAILVPEDRGKPFRFDSVGGDVRAVGVLMPLNVWE